MCQYCNYAFDGGWDQLLEYDDLSPGASPDRATTESPHRFHDSEEERDL